jgi:hypothetical protein
MKGILDAGLPYIVGFCMRSSKEGSDDSVERGWNGRMICMIG